jgi:hypothetical protein
MERERDCGFAPHRRIEYDSVDAVSTGEQAMHRFTAVGRSDVMTARFQHGDEDIANILSMLDDENVLGLLVHGVFWLYPGSVSAPSPPVVGTV